MSTIETLPVPGVLRLSLRRHGALYTTVVRDGQFVRCGQAVAELEVPGGVLALPAPASGVVRLPGSGEGALDVALLEVSDARVQPMSDIRTEPHRITAEALRERLARGGMWPFFWSSRSGGLPALAGEIPKAIIVNCVLVEPFRARGKVVLRSAWDRIIKGIWFLPRLMQDYGTVEIVLTAKNDPVARAMYHDLAGHAWVRFHPVPIVYPIENPSVLCEALRGGDRSFKAEDAIWVVDVQGMEAIGSYLADGVPLHDRIVAAGGPGHPRPKHLSARIGTPASSLLWDGAGASPVRMLRGGLLRGVPVDPGVDAVGWDDDSFFFLPKASQREFLAFLRPGFDRTSYSPCFASRFTGALDRTISTSLRGERRPCIACGRCEEICPARLMPQIIHRYLYRDAIDEAASAGLERCVRCGLCTFVCPSKIDLLQQFIEAQERVRLERSETAAEKAV